MKLYLSRRRNGLYQLTRLEPIVRDMLLVPPPDNTDAYPRPGDPIVLPGLCPFSVKLLIGAELQPTEVMRVEVSVKFAVEDAHHEIRGET